LESFTAFNRQKACRYGQMLYNQNDMYVGRSFDLYGEFSEGEVDLFRQIVRPGNVVVEVGANIGAHTVFLAQHVGREGAVLAIEPQRIVFQTLCANIALNNISNVVTCPQAAGAKHGSVLVPALDYTREANFGALALGDFEHGEPVPVIPLDTFALKKCNFIKIDVEGMEIDVLRGAVGLITRFKPVLYVENDREEKSDNLIRFIDSLGYRMHWHCPLLFNPNNFAGHAENVFGRIVSANMVCTPPEMHAEMHGFNPVQVPPPEPETPG
jgi:FkbM family methyltransferase